MFESVYASKYPLILIARGFHDDVLNTVKINKTRGTMEVYPVIVEFNLEGINKLNDIAIVSSSNLISSNLGQLISSVSIKDASKVEEITIYPNSISIKNSKSTSAVSSHINFLLKKREESKGAEEVYENRIRSLSSNTIVIRLPDTNDFVVKRQTIDYCLRSIKSMIDFGIFEDNKLCGTYFASKRFSNLFHDKLENLGAIIQNS